METIKLDIGSGVAKRAGYITVDNDPSVGADIAFDIFSIDIDGIKVAAVPIKTIEGSEIPYEVARLFSVGCDEIRCHHLLEHLDPNRKVQIMRILYDLLKPGCVLDIEVPLFPHPASVQDPTHISFWCKASFWYFTRGNKFGEAFAKRYSRPAVPLFEFVEDWERGEKPSVWGYGIKLRKPKN